VRGSGDLVADLEQAVRFTGDLLDGVRPQQWDDATPCTDWDLRALTRHVIVGNQMFAQIVSGEIAGPHAADLTVADVADSDLADVYRRSAGALLAAFRPAEVLRREVTVPFGTVLGVVALHLRITELLVHGWDIAHSTGQCTTVPERLAEQELEFTVEKLKELPPGRGPFAPPQPVADDAPALDRLAACLGRAVASPADRS